MIRAPALRPRDRWQPRALTTASVFTASREASNALLTKQPKTLLGSAPHSRDRAEHDQEAARTRGAHRSRGRAGPGADAGGGGIEVIRTRNAALAWRMTRWHPFTPPPCWVELGEPDEPIPEPRATAPSGEASVDGGAYRRRRCGAAPGKPRDAQWVGSSSRSFPASWVWRSAILLFFTAIARARLLPTTITRRLPRVIPV
jgi:hypothetical protein